MSEPDYFDQLETSELGTMEQGRDIADYAIYFGMETEEFSRWMNRFERVADLGSGKSNLSKSFIDRPKMDDRTKIVSVDLEKFSGKPAFVQARGERLPFASKSFDAAVSCMGLFYYAQDLNNLTHQAQEVSRILRPRGEIILNVQIPHEQINLTPSKKSLLALNEFLIHSIEKHRESNFVANIPEILKKSGLDEVDRKVCRDNVSILALHYQKKTS